MSGLEIKKYLLYKIHISQSLTCKFYASLLKKKKNINKPLDLTLIYVAPAQNLCLLADYILSFHFLYDTSYMLSVR